MPIEIAGFAQALARCQVFESVEAAELENVLAAGQEPLEMLFVEPSADVALIRSGEPFTHLYFVQHGMIVPWQYPHSELSSPFLIGDHEFMMGAERWVASYSAATQTTVVAIPVATMRRAVERIPQIRAKMHLVLLRRMARYYWDLSRYQRKSSAEGSGCSDLSVGPQWKGSRSRARDHPTAARHRPPNGHVTLGRRERHFNTRRRKAHPNRGRQQGEILRVCQCPRR